ncbi:hypothetical protein GG344DRAFT_82852 [Lentinula edodes]|nr:hypothetical protein GG344DRAFT_82852 [Lentinula edodes]
MRLIFISSSSVLVSSILALPTEPSPPSPSQNSESSPELQDEQDMKKMVVEMDWRDHRWGLAEVSSSGVLSSDEESLDPDSDPSVLVSSLSSCWTPRLQPQPIPLLQPSVVPLWPPSVELFQLPSLHVPLPVQLS